MIAVIGLIVCMIEGHVSRDVLIRGSEDAWNVFYSNEKSDSNISRLVFFFIVIEYYFVKNTHIYIYSKRR